jgi:hypothetical protein
MPISNWYCEKCRKVVPASDVMAGRHSPLDAPNPKCLGEVKWRTVYVEAAALQRAFDDASLDAVQG